MLAAGLLDKYTEHEAFLEDLDLLREGQARFLRWLARRAERDEYPHGTWEWVSQPPEFARQCLGMAIAHERRGKRPTAPERRLAVVDRYRDSVRDAAERYASAVEAFAARWGLRAPWAAPELHAYLVRRTRFPEWPPFIVMSEVQSAPHMPAQPAEWPQPYVTFGGTLEDYLKKVERVARARWAAAERAAEEAGFERDDTSPQRDQHLRWLFLRLCPQPGHPTGVPVAVIARDACVERQTVYAALKHLSELLSIELPKGTLGRPARV
jgi:hypothetical protein